MPRNIDQLEIGFLAQRASYPEIISGIFSEMKCPVEAKNDRFRNLGSIFVNTFQSSALFRQRVLGYEKAC